MERIINEDSIRKKIDELTNNRSFIAKKIAGKEFTIRCHECNESVRIVVRDDATAICPRCGKTNQLSFGAL